MFDGEAAWGRNPISPWCVNTPSAPGYPMDRLARCRTSGTARMIRRALLAAATVLLLPATAAAAPAQLVHAGKPKAIDGQYIVVMKPEAGADATARAQRTARARGGRVRHEYSRALRGFSVKLSDRALADVRSDPAVASVEPDAVISIAATQSGATFGLDRIDQLELPLTTTYTYQSTGAGVTAYIIDTGIRTTHTQFGGRAVSGFDAVDRALPADDCNGHGTHVAGTVGSAAFGVAKGVRLVAVRVLDCGGSGLVSDVIAGVDYVTGDHAAGAPAVANMSLGGGASTALDLAVNASIADGVTYAIAAGNDAIDACGGSPGRVQAALTVGATDSADQEAYFSNYGSCLDLLAPGVNVTSTWSTSDSATNTISGTSMAAPHVAGVAALYLEQAPGASPATVHGAVVSGSTANTLDLYEGLGTPNRLLYSLIAPVGTSVPQTSIDSGPSGMISSSSVSFAFSSSVAASSFECSLDGPGVATGSYASCSSPRSYAGLSDGSYTVSIRATDPAGNTDASAATRSFTVDTTAPQTTIDSGPTATITTPAAQFGFSADAAATFECHLDGGAWTNCSSPKVYSALPDGDHVFSVRATDWAGNTDPTAPTRAFRVDTSVPNGGGGPASANPGPVPIAPGAAALKLTMSVGRGKLATILAKGLRVTSTCSARCDVKVQVQLDRKTAQKLKLKGLVGQCVGTAKSGTHNTLTIRFNAKVRKGLKRLHRVTLQILLTARDAKGHATTPIERTLTLTN
jgi:aqualysin 1